jgi:hypothetical protein
MASSPETIDAATLPAPVRETIENAARRDESVPIEQAGKLMGVVISPRDYALLLSRKRALADLGDIVETLRDKFSDLPEDVALARAEEAALSAREESRAARTAGGGEDSADSTGSMGQGA